LNGLVPTNTWIMPAWSPSCRGMAAARAGMAGHRLAEHLKRRHRQAETARGDDLLPGWWDLLQGQTGDPIQLHDRLGQDDVELLLQGQAERA